MRLSIRHRTAYRYTEPQRRIVQLLRVRPPCFAGQSVIDWHVEADHDARLRPGRDGYGNETTMLYVDGPVDGIVLTVSGEVLTEDRAGVVAGAPEPLPPGLFLRATPQTRPDAAIAAFADGIAAGAGPIAWLHALNAAIHARLAFEVGEGNPFRTAADALAEGHGVCQDHAHLFAACARLAGIPTRYVSGHLWRADGRAVQPAAHAWAEAYVADLGWVGFDPANGVCPTDAYVRVAAALDYRDAAPVSGARVGGGGEAMDVEVAVDRADGRRDRPGEG